MGERSGTEKKQKILIVHNYYQIPGGEDTVVNNEKKLLEDYGHEVVLYTRDNKELKTMGKFRKLFLPFVTVYNPRTARDVKRIIKERSIDIVHVHNCTHIVSPAVYYAARKYNTPIVQTIHNFRLLCPGATFYRESRVCEDCIKRGLGCAVKHKCYRGSLAQTLICVIGTKIHRWTGIYGKINYIALTEFNKERLLQLKQIKSERVFIKPNFTFALPESFEEERARKYYLFVGRIEEIKGVRLLVKAFSRMPSKLLRIAGKGPLREELESKASSNITFLGQVEHSELMREMSGAKAVILPSQVYEGFPMTVPEAFSMHTPMIVGNIGNNGVLIEDGKTGMKFKHDSVEDLTRTIERFEKSDRFSMGESAYNTYKAQYTSESNYKILKEIYAAVK